MTACGYLFSGRICSATGMPKAQVGAGGGFCDHVMTRHHDGDGLFLDLGHFGKAHAFHCLMDGRAALQFTVKHLNLRSFVLLYSALSIA